METMQTTTVSQLKMSLSAYLRRVKAGEEAAAWVHSLRAADALQLAAAMAWCRLVPAGQALLTFDPDCGPRAIERASTFSRRTSERSRFP